MNEQGLNFQRLIVHCSTGISKGSKASVVYFFATSRKTYNIAHWKVVTSKLDANENWQMPRGLIYLHKPTTLFPPRKFFHFTRTGFKMVFSFMTAFWANHLKDFIEQFSIRWHQGTWQKHSYTRISFYLYFLNKKSVRWVALLNVSAIFVRTKIDSQGVVPHKSLLNNKIILIFNIFRLLKPFAVVHIRIMVPLLVWRWSKKLEFIVFIISV